MVCVAVSQGTEPGQVVRFETINLNSCSSWFTEIGSGTPYTVSPSHACMHINILYFLICSVHTGLGLFLLDSFVCVYMHTLVSGS